MEAQPTAEHPSPKKPSDSSAKPPSSTSKNAALSRTDLTQFFARMEHLYGHRWTGQYGKPLNDQGELTISARQWLADLSTFTPAQIRVALAAIELEHQDWPPTVPQFKALCRGVPASAPDPRRIALERAAEAMQNVMTDAKLGLLPARLGGYDDATLAAIEAVGGAEALVEADYNRRVELGPRFVQTHLARATGSQPALPGT